MRICKLLNSKKLFHISNGYMQSIAFFRLLSNRIPEKWGFWQIKRVNSSAWIHPINLRLKSSISGIFRIDIYRIVGDTFKFERLNSLQINSRNLQPSINENCIHLFNCRFNIEGIEYRICLQNIANLLTFRVQVSSFRSQLE